MKNFLEQKKNEKNPKILSDIEFNVSASRMSRTKISQIG
jgi:hypothetical protein